MTMGGKPAEDWRDEVSPESEAFLVSDVRPDAWALLDEDVEDEIDHEEERVLPARSGLRDKIPALLLMALALSWMGGIAWKIFGSGPQLTTEFTQVISLIALVSGPVAILAIAYLLVGPTSRRESRRYGRTAFAMRSESARLEEIMNTLTDRIEANSAALSGQITMLSERGNATAQSIAEINESMRENISTLARHSLLLGAAATSAREEMKTLLTDLPDAETRMNALTDLLRSAGHIVDSQAAGLQSQLLTLTQRARDADEAAGNAAGRLAKELGKIESNSHNAAQTLDLAASQMGQSVENVIDKASRAVEDSRRGMDIQGSAMIAMIEQGRAALDRAGIESTQLISSRMEEIGRQVDTIAARIASQETASASLFNALQHGLADSEARFASLKETATDKTADLAEAIVALTDHVEHVTSTLGGSAEAADDLLKRAETLRSAIDACARDVNNSLPLALAQLEEQLVHSQNAMRSALPDAERLEHAAQNVAASIDSAGQSLARHNHTLAELGQTAAKQLGEVREEADQLNRLIGAAEESIGALSAGATAQLVDALHRVRQAAVEATERARTALGAVIPDAAEALSNASAEAIERSVAEPVQRQLAEISVAAQRAVQAAQGASEKLMRQMLTIAETSNTIEARIAEAKAENERSDQDNFSRRVSLLIESLNSTAIDVTKVLSNEVTDSAWAAYLRGDRGVFTRRAVKLLDAGEARDISRHYEEEPEFREQVNRYIHDFEAMLRRVLSNRDGTPLGVTMLSSDMGKLYVALAQAIERLRT